MSYDDFNELVRSRLSEICGTEFSVSVYEALKNNSVVHKGISIRENDHSIAPTIYMDEFYTDYCDGRDIEDIINEIIRIYSQNRKGPEVEAGNFVDFEWVKDRIFFKTVNAAENASLLAQVPCSLNLDLAIIYCVYMGNFKGSFSSVMIRNEHLKLWGKDMAEINEYAIRNTPAILPCDIRNMKDIVSELGGFEDDGECGVPMFVLSNKDRVNGAAVMFYDGVLKRAADELGGDLYILPSSIHEVIVIPKDAVMDADDLTRMVAEVNDTQVAKEEILSYSLYEYLRESEKLIIASAGVRSKAATA